MLNAILMRVVSMLLDWLVGRLTAAVSDYEKQQAEDKAQGVIDEANVKRYQENKDRLSRHQSAADLLNGVPGQP